MGIFFVYILKSSFALALFYLFYKLLLNKDTFHRLNRIMLLFIIALSSLLPLINTTVEHPTELNHSFMTIEDMLIMQSVAVINVDSSINAPKITWYEIVVIVYFLGLVFFMFRNCWSIYSILKLMRSGKLVENENGIKVIIHRKNIPPFSWMKYILISEKDYNENFSDILIHEKAHISRRHSFDIMLADFFIFIQWFNPAAWLLKQELKNIHEFEADDMVLKSGIDAKKYQLLLIEKAVGPKLFSIANNFNHSSLKKRITMMLKKKSNPWARMKYLYVVPISVLAVAAFARPEVNDELNRLSEVQISVVSSTIKESLDLPEQVIESDDTIIEVKSTATVDADDTKTKKLSLRVVDDSGKPIQGASVLIEGTTIGSLTDKDGKFTIDANIGDIVYISFVGKETLKFPVKESTMNMKANLMMFDAVEKLNHITVVSYSSEKIINETKQEPAPKEDEKIVFQVVEQMPEFPGGMAKCKEFLSKNIRYPVNAQENGIQGTVVVQFVVSRDGSINDPYVVRSVSPELDEEAIRVIKSMPKWIPGKQRNVAVDVKYTMPIIFQLIPEKKVVKIDSQNFNCLVLVDGKEVSNESMKDLNPNTIDNISVLKQGPSIEKFIKEFGDKAKDGVILITTKKSSNE